MLQSELSVKGNQELEPFRLLILYKKRIRISETCNATRKFGFTIVFTRSRDLWSQFRFKNKKPMYALRVVFEVNCNDYRNICKGNLPQIKGNIQRILE